MKSLVTLWALLAEELASLCGTNAKRDIETLSRRVKEEGDSFLKISLPAFGKSFDQALALEQVSSDHFLGFRRGSGGLPLFLGGFLQRIFDSNGTMIDEPCIESISAIRQLTALCGKVEEPASEARQKKSVRAFIEADEACLEWDLTVPPELLQELITVSTQVIYPALRMADRCVSNDQVVPKHGPGQTADRLLGNEKYDLWYWPDHLESRFPWVEWAIPNYRWADHKSSFDDRWNTLPYVGPVLREPRDPSVPARLCLVPKTASAMRVIVMEPTSLQYMQQGLMALLVDAHEAFSDQIGFTDQELNRSMARRGSIFQDVATIDLSEASDRVTYLQAASVFSNLPHLWEALDATRSSEVKLPDGDVLPVGKFASMGSAVCFPVEASVFLTAVYMAIKRHHRKTNPWFDLTPKFIQKMNGRVRVYGDDIIVPIEYLPSVREVFSDLGWKINPNKTFGTGRFRESCGGDYWDGYNVTPVRVRHPIAVNRRQVEATESLVSLRNQLYEAGYWRTVRHLDEHISALLGGIFPIADEEASGLVRISSCFRGRARGTDRYQRACTRVWVTRSPIPKNQASELGTLLKCLTHPGKDDEHLLRSGRPVVARMYQRWTPVLNEELVGNQNPERKDKW